MKKFVPLICLLLFFTIGKVNVYANTEEFSLFNETCATSEEYLSDNGYLEITSGINKDVESTFDSVRTIVGKAPEDTTVLIEVYKYSEDSEDFSKTRTYDIVVGKSGVFSKSIDLETGRNYIKISATSGDIISVKTALINRKDMEIKKELENRVVLPTELTTSHNTAFAKNNF